MQFGPVVTLPDGPHRVAAVESLAGGTSKGVRRVRFEDGGSVVVYTWAPAEDRWRGTSDAGDDEPFVPAPGPGPLLAATALPAARVPAIGAVTGPLRETLGRLLIAVRPRPGYSLVHGELGPEHVLVAGGEPVLIDVEGLMFADAEWEHAYLRMRLGDRYAPLDPGDLDPARLEVYALALHLSLVAGPLRLAGESGELGAFMRRIAAHHAEQVLAAG
jgi:hypothetical protein